MGLIYQLIYVCSRKYPQGGQFFLNLPSQDMQKGTNAHPQDKSEYQLPPPHLNILVPQDKLDVIMHPPSRQKTVAAHPSDDNFWNSS